MREDVFQINVLYVSIYLGGLRVLTIAPLASLNAFSIQWNAHLSECVSFPLSWLHWVQIVDTDL